MKPVILIVDDCEDLVEFLKMNMKIQGYDCKVALDPESALHCLTSERVDLVLSDYSLPKKNGLELFHEIRETSQVPFILISGYTDLMSDKDVEKTGLAGFLAKPFGSKELTEAISSALGKNRTETENEGDFYNIPISNMITDFQIPCSIFLKLNDEKYVKLVNSGDSLTGEKLENYKEKDVKFLFIKKNEYDSFVEFQLSIGKSYLADTGNSNQKIQSFLVDLEKLIYEKLISDGLDKQAILQSQAVLELALCTIGEDDQALELLNKLKGTTVSLYEHSLGVSFFSTMIGQKLTGLSVSDHKKLALAGLFHDVGKTLLGKDFLNDIESSPSEEQQELIENHAMIGSELLLNTKIIGDEIGQIVLLHEDCLGTAHWQDPAETGGLPLVHIVAVANRFCNLIAVDQSTEDNIDEIINSLSDSSNQIVLDALASLFGKIRVTETAS